MQLMTWTLGRLGSRFGLQFEPYKRRVMHSGMGRFLDRPLDLAVGLVEPDGQQRVLPFTTDNDHHGVEQFSNCEQFDRMNSITFRGYSERYHLRFEMNVHSVFYPQNERLSVMPAFYLELRVSPEENFRNTTPVGPVPDEVELFIRIRRGDTNIVPDENGRGLRMDYEVPLEPIDPWARLEEVAARAAEAPVVTAYDRLASLNENAVPVPTGNGLTLKLPVSESSSGIKWRLVWASHVADPVLRVRQHGEVKPVWFRYTEHWSDVDAVVDEAIRTRDERLALSRRFEKMLDQASLDASQRHLTNHSYQNFLSNTFWCTTAEPVVGLTPEGDAPSRSPNREWFSSWDGSCFYHSAVDVEYNASMFYFSLWPRLLRLLIDQWAERVAPHGESGGAIVPHDLGMACIAVDQAYPHEMPVEENSNFLLLLESYAHWTGDVSRVTLLANTIDAVATYLLWADPDESGFPSRGVANSMVDAGPALQYARKQTYLAVKRVAALRAAASLLRRAGKVDAARACDLRVDADLKYIEDEAWLGDHYAVAADKSALELVDPESGEPLAFEELPGWDAYSIYTGNGLVLPEMIGRPPVLDRSRLTTDCYRANLECKGRYGDGHTSDEPQNCRISQNLWRDMLARYLNLGGPSSAQDYWDLQVMSNTHAQSLGYTDTYIHNRLHNYPRGVVTLGYFLSTPRLMIDRLTEGGTGTYITVDPDRHTPQRWPLLPLADWQAGKIPVCVVHTDGRVTIEAQTDPVVVRSSAEDPNATVSGIEFIG
ncbi:MAG: DUF4965 domain-containing protein [Algisphaera sp.]